MNQMFDERIPIAEIVGLPDDSEEDFNAVPVPRPIDWWLAEGFNAKKYLTDLNSFVQTLVVSYVLPEQVVPRCWYLHEALILELFAIKQFRNQVAYEQDTGGPAGPIEFHVQLNLAIARLRNWTELCGCNAAEHFSDKNRMPVWVDKSSEVSAAWAIDFETHLAKISDEKEKFWEKEMKNEN